MDTSEVVKGDAVQVVDGVRQIKGLSGRCAFLSFAFSDSLSLCVVQIDAVTGVGEVLAAQ